VTGRAKPQDLDAVVALSDVWARASRWGSDLERRKGMAVDIDKRRRARWGSLALVGALSLLLAQLVFAGPASAQVAGPVLYGYEAGFDDDNLRNLYTIDPATGARGQIIGPPAVGGAAGFELTGLAVDPTTGQMYGSTSDGDEIVGAPAIVKLNQATGAASFVGYVFLDCSSPIQDITFTTTGQMFGWTKNCGGGDRLVQINKTTGRGTALGPSGLGFSNGGGLAADPDDNTLWLTPEGGAGDYGTLDPATGVYTSQGTLDGTGNWDDNINALAWSCDGETLYASVRDGFFATINTAADDLIEVGRGAPDQDALAWDCSPPQPVVLMCKGQAATLVGTSGNDVLTGTSGRDVVAALGGNDVVTSLGGNDLICAGAGRDKVNAGGGKDRLLGQGGNDRLRGAGGKDNLRGGGGTDKCNGGPGKDKGNCEKEVNIP
jgi:Ca2+-binding RTX toxin-like protein